MPPKPPCFADAGFAEFAGLGLFARCGLAAILSDFGPENLGLANLVLPNFGPSNFGFSDLGLSDFAPFGAKLEVLSPSGLGPSRLGRLAPLSAQDGFESDLGPDLLSDRPSDWPSGRPSAGLLSDLPSGRAFLSFGFLL